jgi:hypothetical protein
VVTDIGLLGIKTVQNYAMFQQTQKAGFEGLLIENEPSIVSTKRSILKSNNRVSGSIDL